MLSSSIFAMPYHYVLLASLVFVPFSLPSSVSLVAKTQMLGQKEVKKVGNTTSYIKE